MDDKKIVDLFFERDQKAINEVSNKYFNYLFVISNNIINSFEDAKEIVNDTMLKLWDSIPPNKPENLKSYSAKIARNLTIDKYRKENAEKRGSNNYDLALDELDKYIPSDKTDINEEIDNIYFKEKIEEFLDGLKKEERLIFIYRYWYFYSIDEISKKYGFTNSKVKMALLRTREKLKKYLVEEGINL